MGGGKERERSGRPIEASRAPPSFEEKKIERERGGKGGRGREGEKRAGRLVVAIGGP